MPSPAPFPFTSPRSPPQLVEAVADEHGPVTPDRLQQVVGISHLLHPPRDHALSRDDQGEKARQSR